MIGANCGARTARACRPAPNTVCSLSSLSAPPLPSMCGMTAARPIASSYPSFPICSFPWGWVLWSLAISSSSVLPMPSTSPMGSTASPSYQRSWSPVPWGFLAMWRAMPSLPTTWKSPLFRALGSCSSFVAPWWALVSAFFGSTPIPPRSSWATPAPWPWGRPWPLSPSSRGRSWCW